MKNGIYRHRLANLKINVISMARTTGIRCVLDLNRIHHAQRLFLAKNTLVLTARRQLLGTNSPFGTQLCNASQKSGQQKTTLVSPTLPYLSSVSCHSVSKNSYVPNTQLFHICKRWKSTEEKGLPEISEEDLEENFTRGHGPGGQSVNKTTNCCVLKHVPTGVAVKVHETRSLDQNRKIARLRLRQKLDLFYNGDESKLEIEKRLASIRRKEKKKKTNQRLEKLKAFKEREGLT